MNEILARAKFRGHGYTRTQFVTSFGTTVYEAGEIIWTNDGYITWADGTTQYQNLKYIRIEPTTGDFYTFRNTILGGAFAIGSGGRLTITTGTYNALDVADTARIFADVSGGAITLNGFTNGVSQRITLIKTSGANNLVINDNSASATSQKIFTENGTNLTFSVRANITFEQITDSSGFYTDR